LGCEKAVKVEASDGARPRAHGGLLFIPESGLERGGGFHGLNTDRRLSG
jgi:hypothetical protein